MLRSMRLDPAKDPWTVMAANNAWANATLYAVLTALPGGAFTAARPGFFGSLSAVMNHVLTVDLYYLDALEAGGLGRGARDRADMDDAARLAELQAEVDARLVDFCRGLTDEVLSETRATDRERGPVDETVAALLLHLFQHQVHHRGQAHGMLSHAGIDPPQLDDFHLVYGRVESAERWWR